jgi:hypothetical protein
MGYCCEVDESGEVLDMPLVPLTPVRLKLPQEGDNYTSPFQKDRVRPLQIDASKEPEATASEATASETTASTAPSETKAGAVAGQEAQRGSGALIEMV